MNEILLKYWVLTTGFLAVKMWSNSMVQVVSRFKYKAFINEEDAKEFGSMLKAELVPVNEEHPLVQRASLCWRNDLENIPLFLIIALGYVMVGGNTNMGVAYFVVYCVCRVLHTFFYLNRIQPWRTVVYEIGSATTVAILIHSIWQAFQ